MSDSPVSPPNDAGPGPTMPTGDPVDLREQTPDPVRLAEYRRYVDAQKAVDRLSDGGFPMAAVTIVWAGLRRIEHVTGRQTVATAARDGLLTGAWFGFVIGFLFSAFADSSTAVLPMVVTYTVFGALTVAAFQAFQHWARRGTRDFATVSQLDAERYEVWVEPAHHAEAKNMLALPASDGQETMP